MIRTLALFVITATLHNSPNPASITPKNIIDPDMASPYIARNANGIQ